MYFNIPEKNNRSKGALRGIPKNNTNSIHRIGHQYTVLFVEVVLWRLHCSDTSVGVHSTADQPIHMNGA